MNDLLRRILFLPEQGSTFAIRADRLHYFIIIATMVVATAVGVVGLMFLVRFRRRPDSATTLRVEAPLWLEALFVGFPLAFFLLWFFIGFRDFVWAASPPSGALDVYVTAKQWMWKFSYPEGPSSVGVLHVPAGRPIRLLLTSRDVIHSFFVPDFRMKKDAVPSRYTEAWFEAPVPGRHQVLCAEYCGLDHSQMRAEVVVLTQAEFDAWRRSQKSPPAIAVEGMEQAGEGSLAQQGRTFAAELGCLKCHSIDGSPHIGPTWVGLFGREERLSTGERIRVDEAYLTESMMLPKAKVVAGFEPVMPSFFGRVSPPETAALIEFIKSLRPLRTGATVQQEPSDGPISR